MIKSLSKIDWQPLVAVIFMLMFIIAMLHDLGKSIEQCPTSQNITVEKAWAGTWGGVRTQRTYFYVSDPAGELYRFESNKLFARIQIGHTYTATIDTCLAKWANDGIPILEIEKEVTE